MKNGLKLSFASALTTLLMLACLALSSPVSASVGGTCGSMDVCSYCPGNFRWTTSTCTDANGRTRKIGLCFTRGEDPWDTNIDECLSQPQ